MKSWLLAFLVHLNANSVRIFQATKILQFTAELNQIEL